MKSTDIIGLILLVFLFRNPLLEYTNDFFNYIDKQVVAVANIDKPSDEVLERIRETDIDDFEYTYNDKRVLGVYFHEFSKNVLKIDGKKSNEVILNHFSDSIVGFVNDEKIDKKYPGLTDEIEKLFKEDVAKDGVLGQIGEDELKDVSETAHGIAWVIVND